MIKKITFKFLPALLLAITLNVGQAVTDDLIEAAKNGKLQEVRELIDKGADVNAKGRYNGKDGHTALIQASGYGHKKVVELLIDKGADIDAKGEDGYTALIWASAVGRKDVVALLINKGADIKARNIHGQTALIEASESGNKDVVALLIDKGADIDAKDRMGLTAEMWASRKNYKEIVELLKAHDPALGMKEFEAKLKKIEGLTLSDEQKQFINDYKCPISLVLPYDPVNIIVKDKGKDFTEPQLYERSALNEWKKKSNKSPTSRRAIIGIEANAEAKEKIHDFVNRLVPDKK